MGQCGRTRKRMGGGCAKVQLKEPQEASAAVSPAETKAVSGIGENAGHTTSAPAASGESVSAEQMPPSVRMCSLRQIF